MSKRNKFLVWVGLFVALTLVFSMLLPVGAQSDEIGDPVVISVETPVPTAEPTAAPPTDPGPVQAPTSWGDVLLTVALLGFIVLLGIKELSLRALIVQLGASVPATLYFAGKSALGSIIQSGEQYTATTTDTLDDEALARAKIEYEAIIAEIEKRRGYTGTVKRE